MPFAGYFNTNSFIPKPDPSAFGIKSLVFRCDRHLCLQQADHYGDVKHFLPMPLTGLKFSSHLKG